MKRLLNKFSVLQATDGVAVRYCAALFAALGARVVTACQGDDAGIGYAGESGETYGQWLDRGKSPVAPKAVDGMCFDLVLGGQDAAGVAAAQVLMARTTGDPILIALTWFDLSGPYGDWIATDEVIAALNGTAFSFGERQGPPMLVQGHPHQITAGLVAFNAALAGLLESPAQRPRRIDVNVFEASLCYAETAALTGRAGGGESGRLGINRFAPTYPASPYRTLDGWVGVTCLTPAQWQALCRLIERPDLSADPACATAYQRLMVSDGVDAALVPAFSTLTTAAWVALGIAHRIPITPMRRPGELPDMDHWRERGAFGPFGAGEVQGPTLPFRMRFDGVAPPPRLGVQEDGPLAGLRVIDFSMGWAGPLCARTLGDLGADVIKIESEGHPDWWRGWESGSVDAATRETKPNFIDMNRNKRGVSIDLTTMEGKAQARALVATADVVVENFAAGVLEKLGLGPATQRALRPGIISLSMPAFGNGGPLSGLRAYGSTVEQASGLPFVNGESHWPPAQQHVAFGDPIAGLYGAGAILAALVGRADRGGCDIDLAQVACLFQIGADAIIAEQVTGGPAPRTGHKRARLPLCAVVASGDDQWLAVVAPTGAELQGLARLTGGQDVADLASWAAGLTAQAARDSLQACGLGAAQVAPAHGLTFDPQLVATGFWAEMDRAFVGRHLVGSSPFRFDGARLRLRRPAPLLGEHTEEVLTELLSLA